MYNELIKYNELRG